MSRRNKKNTNIKLDEFPEDFDDVLFHNKTVSKTSQIQIIRNEVYKAVRNAIIDRITSYKEIVPLNDDFNVTISVDKKKLFYSYAIVREELLDRGFDARFEYDIDDVDKKFPSSIIIPVERKTDTKITLTEKLSGEDNEEESDDE